MQYRRPVMDIINYKNGIDGRAYILHSSADILQVQENGIISPGFIDFEANYRDGQSTQINHFEGIFVIEESLDDVTWNVVYESEVPESYVRHEIYAVLTERNGAILTLASGDAIGVSRKLSSVRCTLYTSDKQNVIDFKTIRVFKDASALTHEEIFNLLTKNGEIKGIYKEGNQLYISFTYARGGELVLGGENNLVLEKLVDGQ